MTTATNQVGTVAGMGRQHGTKSLKQSNDIDDDDSDDSVCCSCKIGGTQQSNDTDDIDSDDSVFAVTGWVQDSFEAVQQGGWV